MSNTRSDRQTQLRVLQDRLQQAFLCTLHALTLRPAGPVLCFGVGPEATLEGLGIAGGACVAQEIVGCGGFHAAAALWMCEITERSRLLRQESVVNPYSSQGLGTANTVEAPCAKIDPYVNAEGLTSPQLISVQSLVQS